MILAIHNEALTHFGGTPGLRDAGLLESALNKAKNHPVYGDPSLFELSAVYCEGLCQNHAFVDGNKRTALLGARAFLFLNGYAFEPEESDEVRLMVALANKEADRQVIADWFRDYSRPSPD